MWESPKMAVATPLRTVTGAYGTEVLPTPSWPRSLLPQQESTPDTDTAQEWCAPAAIEAMLLLNVNTVGGESICKAAHSPHQKQQNAGIQKFNANPMEACHVHTPRSRAGRVGSLSQAQACCKRCRPSKQRDLGRIAHICNNISHNNTH